MPSSEKHFTKRAKEDVDGNKKMLLQQLGKASQQTLGTCNENKKHSKKQNKNFISFKAIISI